MVRALRHTCAIASGVVIASWTSIAIASPSAKLTYARDAGAERCPDEAHVRSAVAARVGYDPFFPWAKQTVIVEVEPSSKGFRGRVHILDENGVARGARTIETSGGDCGEIVSALALAISLGLDSLEASKPPEEKKEPPPPSQENELPPSKGVIAPAPIPPPIAIAQPSAPSRSSRERIAPFARAAIVGALGAAPSSALGGVLAVGARARSVSIAIEGRADFASSANTSLGSVSGSLYLTSIVPCVHVDAVFAFGCAIGSAGSFVARGDRQASAPFFAAGARFGFEIPISNTFGAITSGDLLGTFTPHRILIDGAEAYHLPTFSSAFQLGIIAQF
jgi:hypothetical protein